jgi:hypothetical protein
MSLAPYGKRTIAIDFDHTLTVTEDEYRFGSEEPNEEMIEWVRERYYEGHTIIIWTARPWDEAGYIAGLLTMWGVRWHGLRCEKGGADMFVDDKAYNPWDMTALGDVPSAVKDMEWPTEEVEEKEAERTEA